MRRGLAPLVVLSVLLVSGPALLAQTGPPTASDAQFSHCPRCGNALKEGATACSVCGLSVQRAEEAEVIFCPRCENAVLKGTTQCPVCLMPIGQTTLQDIYDEGEFTFLAEGRVDIGLSNVTYRRSRPGFKSKSEGLQYHIGADLWAYLHTSWPVGLVARYDLFSGPSDTERGRFQQGVNQRNRLDLVTHVADIGYMAPLRLFGLEVAPFGAITWERQVLERSSFFQNGAPFVPVDLDGQAQPTVEEKRRFLGATVGGRITWRPEEHPFELNGWFAYTASISRDSPFHVKIRHEIFGTFRQRAQMFRVKLEGRWYVIDDLAIGLGLGYLFQEVRTTSLKVVAGGASAAIGQSPGASHQILTLDLAIQYKF